MTARPSEPPAIDSKLASARDEWREAMAIVNGLERGAVSNLIDQAREAWWAAVERARREGGRTERYLVDPDGIAHNTRRWLLDEIQPPTRLEWRPDPSGMAIDDVVKVLGTAVPRPPAECRASCDRQVEGVALRALIGCVGGLCFGCGGPILVGAGE